MAASQEQKVDFLLKKIGYVASKTGIAEDSSLSGTDKAPFAEVIPSPLIVPSSSVWSDSSLIPTTPPGSSNATIQVYPASGAKQLTVDHTIAGNRTFLSRTTPGNTASAMQGDWIDPSFHSSYVVEVWKGDPNSGGTQLPMMGSGTNDGWFFDYSSGVLNFNGDVVPTGVTTTNIYIVGYRYIGGKGIQPTSGIGTFTSVISGIATFTGLVDIDGGAAANTLIVEDLTENRVVIAGAGGEIEDSANLTFDGTLLTVVGVATLGNIKIDANEIHTNSGNLTIDSAGGNVIVDDDLKVVGLITAANAYIVGDLTVEGTTTTLNTNLTEVDKLEVGANNTTVGVAITQSGTGDILNLYDGSTEVFSIEDGGRIVATATNNVIPFLYANYSDLPSASTYHGAFAHVHSTGSAYYAHANAWYELVRRELTGIVGTGTDRYNIGFIDATNLDVSGVSTFAGAADFNGNIDVDGYTELDDLNVAGVSTFAGAADFNGNIDVDGYTELDDLNVAGVSTFAGLVDINGGGQANTFKVEDLTSGRVVLAGTGGELEDTANLVFSGTNLTIGTATTVGLDIETRRLNVSGIATFTSIDINGSIDIDGVTDLDTVNIAETLNVTGIATFANNIDANGNLDVDGQTDLDVLNVAEGATFSDIVYLNGTVSAASSTGANGQVLQSTGVGVTWTTTPATRTNQTFTATEDQQTFNFNYNIGFLDVFYNGVKLASSEFTATNGTTIILGDVAYAGDIVEFVSYNTISIGSGGGGGASILADLTDVSIPTTPVIGEILQHNGTTFVNDFTTSQTTTSTSQVALLSLDLSVYRSAEYTIQATEGSNYHVTKILAMHDGSVTAFNEYGTLINNTSVASFDVDISGSNMRLLATPAGTNSTVFKVKFTAIKV